MNAKTQIVAEPGKQELTVTRDFNAPRELVFRAHTDPKLFVRWFGCNDMTTTIDQFEPKNSGKFRYIQRLKDQEFASHGVYHEVVSAERIVKTAEFEGYPGHVLLETTRFETLPDGKTRVTTQSVFQSVADRDGMVKAGVEKGAGETFDRLEEVLKELKSKN